MNPQVYVPIALKLYEYSLSRILDKTWIEKYIPLQVSLHISGIFQPSDLLHRTLPNGFLMQWGCWLFEEYFLENLDFIYMGPFEKWEFLGELNSLLIDSGYSHNWGSGQLDHWLLRVGDIYEEARTDTIFKMLYSRERCDDWGNEIYDEIRSSHEAKLQELRLLYAQNYAERVFHDREQCEYISYCIAEAYDFKGVPTRLANGLVLTKLAQRQPWPKWTLPTLQARERGHCAACKLSFQELDGEPQIDHIIPLSKGGCNDLVNLQLLCESCNNNKGSQIQRVTSSIPNYLKWHKSMGAQKQEKPERRRARKRGNT